MSDYTSIPTKELEQLQKDKALLECLRHAGVDNWDGWDFALEEFQTIYPDD
jgi:hypothetical protein